MVAKTEVKKNPIAQGVEFFHDSWQELQKVHRPSKQDTIQSTIAVLLMVGIVSAFLGLADLGAGALMRYLLSFQ